MKGVSVVLLKDMSRVSCDIYEARKSIKNLPQQGVRWHIFYSRSTSGLRDELQLVTFQSD